ncbi:MAG TPA: transporter [Gammaproteobacteria bacterium]|nr:transporter [Gammaproteobacteria bacterium]
MTSLLLAALLYIGLSNPCFALEPEPSKWNHLPVNGNITGLGYAYTEADILLDPALLLEDVKLEMDSWVGKYVRTFELFDKSARFDLTQAYQEGDWTGLLDGVPAAVSRSGLADSLVRLAINLYGAPPLSGKKFAAYRSTVDVETIVGVALAVRLPTGEYMDDKLINLGNNRFVFRPQIGVIHTRGKWSAEVTGEVAFYTDNDEFFNGKTLEQKPLYIVHSHLIYKFRPGFWASMSAAYDYGGETSINGVDKDDRRQEIAWAVNLAYPINNYSGFRLTYINTRTQESTGLDSDTIAASLSLLW